MMDRLVIYVVFSLVLARAFTHPLTLYKNKGGLERLVHDIPCGGGTCPDGNTCCEDGCCPLPDAVCCSNARCCPSGSTCSPDGEYCEKDGSKYPMLNLNSQLPDTRRPERPVQDIPCAGGTCPDGDTCCDQDGGTKVCCPLPDAECCSNARCCPSGSTCTPDGEHCERDGSKHPILNLQYARRPERPVQDIPCGGGTCPDGNTCCDQDGGTNVCCPVPNGVCCSNARCCPSGSTCTPDGEHCERDGSKHPILNLQYARRPERPVQDIPCGGGTCPDGNTCCDQDGGTNVCCPVPNGVCCSNARCCPSGSTCTPDGEHCERDGSKHPILNLQYARRPKRPVQDIPCGGGTCPDGNTCCDQDGGDKVCCPVPNGVCCSNARCCPSGSTCTPDGVHCERDGSKHPILNLQYARRPERPVQDIPCGGGTCPDGNTCCDQDGGDKVCCPVPNGVCCSNARCCPSGSTCTPDGEHCERDGSKHPILNLQYARRPERPVQDIPCGGGTCPDGNTCCDQDGGTNVCCPVPNGVCCSNARCCPSGSTCTPDGEHCERDGSKHPILNLQYARRPERPVQDIPCGGGTCPDGNTCCDQDGGTNVCCPVPNGVCCSNARCCPSGSTCTPDGEHCERDGSKHPILNLQYARRPERPVQDIPCGGGTCPDGNTCCDQDGGDKVCCPVPNGVCCSNARCCPSGSTCTPDGEHCERGGSKHPILNLQYARRPERPIQDIPCAGGTCPDGDTCCDQDGGTNVCCPVPNGVCCSNARCCPSGSTCSPDGDYCEKDGSKHPLLNLEKRSA